MKKEHESTKNDEGQGGTIYSTNNDKGSANNGIGSQTYYSGTTNDISTRGMTEGI
jgi:hypothetical protein